MRPHYCTELFDDIISYSRLDKSKTALEIGPGTGQATEPILKTGCSYTAVELGEHLADYTKHKFNTYRNFQIENADFETYDFGDRKFDLIYSAATIQWIPEKIALYILIIIYTSVINYCFMISSGIFILNTHSRSFSFKTLFMTSPSKALSSAYAVAEMTFIFYSQDIFP